jgi:outer membrane protein TolC
MTAAAESPKPVWTLADVTRIAVENNPDLKAARARLDQASARIGIYTSQYLPHLDVSAGFDETTLPSPSAGSSALVGIAEPYTSGVVALRQLVFDFGQALARIESGIADSRAREQDASAVLADVKLAVERAFYNVIAADLLVQVAEKGTAQFQETFRTTKVLVDTGARPSFDLTQAQVELAKARLTLIQANNAAKISRVVLLTVMGQREQVEFETREAESAVPAPPASHLDLRGLTRKALDARPELRSAEYSAESARQQLSGEARTFFPTFSAQAWYGKYLPEYPVNLRDAWGAGVGLTWNLFAGLETNFRIRELGARVEEQDAGIEKQREAVSSQVTSSYMDLATSEDALKVAEEALGAARENLRLAKRRYDANVGTILELLIAETSLVNAEAVQVQSRYGYNVALATLKRAVGAALE